MSKFMDWAKRNFRPNLWFVAFVCVIATYDPPETLGFWGFVAAFVLFILWILLLAVMLRFMKRELPKLWS